MAVARSSALKLDWAKLGSQLGLKGQTAGALAAFKKRHDDAARRVRVLQEQPQSVDFSNYRRMLGNTAVVDEIERSVKGWKPASYDVARQVKTIEAFENAAVTSAQETKVVVENELKALEMTLKNIEGARAFEQLTVDDVATAEPEIDKRTEHLVSKGQWNVPGYDEKFGSLSAL